tara:strand:- start:1041 stop:1661 length:621 start_codon:yes stop_codon:yes gene_type:complete
LACGLIVAMFTFAGAANAALITQTLNFTFNNFVPAGLATTPSLVAEATGSVSFTYDTATPTSIVGQAVDSISFTSPTPPGFAFLTSNVMFDLRIGADKLFASNSYEIDVYQDFLGVELNKTGDFLLRVGAFGPIGADVPGPGAMASQFLLIDQPGFDGFYKFDNASIGATTSTSVPVTAEIAEPAPLIILGLGLAALGLIRRRAAA